MEALPSKLRELVLDAYDAGLKTAEVVKRYKVSPAWARRVKQQFRERGQRTATVQAKHGPAPKLDAQDRQRLAMRVERTPDATLAELKDELKLSVSISTIDRALRALRLTLKKSRSAPPSRTART
jgi:transposase